MSATGDNPDDLVRRVRSEISSWTPQRGPNWHDLAGRAGRRPLKLLGVYTAASLALGAILVVAFLAMAALNLGSSLAGGPPVTSVQVDR